MNYLTTIIQMPLVRETAKLFIRSPVDTYNACLDLVDMAQESFHVLSLNTRNGLINRHMASMGIVDSSLVHPREVFREVIKLNASACLLVHNHPSGDKTPSAEDLRITRQLIEAGKIIDIKVLDHVIIGRTQRSGDPGYLSMREAGLLTFT